MKHYIRFGNIPKNEKSSIFNGQEKIGEEAGVSVFDTVLINNEWRIVLPYNLKPEVGFDLYNLINAKFETCYKVDNPLKVFLVSGDEVGSGSDGEPVIKNVKIIKELYT